MACLNNDNLPYLITYDDNNPQKVTIDTNPAELGRIKLKQDYYFIMFSDARSFKTR